MYIRLPVKSDLADIKLVLKDTDLFPVEMLEEMMAPFFDDPQSRERWLVCENTDGRVFGFSYVRPEPLTEGTWNLLAIGFRREHKGHGHGKQLIANIEHDLSAERVLIVETSGLEEFATTRSFYEKCGYEQEAIIRDYWARGDDKVIYRKALNGA